MTEYTLRGPARLGGARLGLGGALYRIVAGHVGLLTTTIRRWEARSRQRRALSELAELNTHLLKDIGLTREAAEHEAAKRFWQG
jgi:uncharacterized protein YjiS (DUF1127 family)